jgi:DNA end-binding protein Ku
MGGTNPRAGRWLAMAARAFWSGQIRLALVSIPVEVYPATRTAGKIGFHMIHEPSGERVRYEKVVPGIGAVDPDEIVKGFELEKDEYVLLDDEEIEAAKVESRRTLDLVQFVEAGAIDVLFYEKPYFVVPAEDLAEEAYVVLREALDASGKVGLGQVSVRGQEHLVALKPCGRGMVLEMLRYAEEVQEADSLFGGIGTDKPQAELLDLARSLIEQKSAAFEPGKFHDRYQEALRRLIDKKAKARGRRVIEDPDIPAPTGGNVIDLMAALRKSLDSDAKDAAPARKKPARPAAKRKRA